MSNLTVNPKEFGIEENQALELTVGLNPILEERAKLIDRFNEIKDLEPTLENIAIFRKLRLEFQKNRTQGVNQWHKVIKEIPLRMGQLVDAVNRSESQTNKNYEDPLEAKEKHFERLEEQRIEALNKERIELVSKCGVDGTNLHLGSMTNDVWDAYYSGVVSKYEQEQEQLAREEEERIAKEKKEALHSKRKEELIPLWGFMTEDQQHSDFSEFTQAEFEELVTELVANKQRQEAQIEAQRIENERLKKEADEKASKLKERNDKLRPYISLIRDYDKLLEMNDSEFESELKVLNKAAIEQANFETQRQAELKAERGKQAKLEAELQAKKDDEAKAEKDRLAKEEADKKEAEKLAKAPIKKQLTFWVDSFRLPQTSVDNATSKEIIAKFEAFKKWSKEQIESL